MLDHGAEPDRIAALAFRKTLRQSYDAQRQGYPGLDGQPVRRQAKHLIHPRIGQINPGKLGGAATHIHHQGRVGLTIQEGKTPGDRQLRLFLG